MYKSDIGKMKLLCDVFFFCKVRNKGHLLGGVGLGAG